MLKLHFGKILVLLLSILLIGVYHFELISNPNSIFLGDAQDGFKNYYTLIYHIKHDATYSHFEGMNYPYGEQVVFTDNQPFLSNSIKFISRNIIDISDYTVGIMNILMLLSIVLTCYILYLLLKRFKIPDLWAALFAVGIGFMAPQVHRMGGHYALSYGFIIPLIMLLWVRFRDSPLPKNSLVIGMVVLIASLLHMYYFALCAFFLAGYWVLTNMYERKQEHLIFTTKHLFLQVILPFILLQVWFFLTDDVGDRPSNPYGFLAYRAHWQGVFLPITYPLGNFIHSIKALPQIEWEGIGYVGIIPGLICLRYLALLTWNFVTSKGKTIRPISDDTTLNYLFFATFCVLLFAFGYPFKLNLEFLLEYLGPLKQFRSIGRFSWVFYYGVNLIAFVILFKIINALPAQKVMKTVLLSLSVVVLFYESHMFQAYHPFYKLNKTPELENKNSATFQKGTILNINTESYQAILPLPYFHSGSENIIAHDKGDIGKNTMLASISSGLPLCAVNMSRTSFSQTLNNLQLILEPYKTYEVLEEYEPTKPILLWIEKNQLLSQNEQALADHAKVVYSDEEVILASFEFSGFNELLNKYYTAVRYEAKHTTLYPVNGFQTRDSVLNYYHEYTQNENGAIKDWNSTPSQGNVQDKNVIFNNTLPLQDTSTYVMSLWVKFNEDLHPTSRLFFDELNEKEEIVFGESWSFGELVKVLDGDWALIEYEFKPLTANDQLRFTLTRDTHQKMTIFWKDLLIRPKTNDVFYFHDDDAVFKNGRTYENAYFVTVTDVMY